MSTRTYEIRALDFLAHEFVLRLRLAETGLSGRHLTLPAWIPGSYMIRDFARNITAIGAHDANGAVALSKIDKQTWRIGDCGAEVVIDYRVYAFDLSVRGAYLDHTRAYFNGTCLFLALDGDQDAPWKLTLRPPVEGSAEGWQVATALPARDTDERGFGLYAGERYADLIDCPVEIGVFQRAEFAVGAVPHHFVVSEGGRFDIERICRDIAPICREHVAMFGELPVDRYTFLTLATPDGYGGLEHRDSTSLMCKRSDLPSPGVAKPDKGYRRYLGLCSHEYFHLWNVKRIRPARLAEADLSAEAYTELLWAFEGITSYYDELALARSGVLTAEDYLDLFATTVTRVLRNPGRARQSVAASSFDAWTKFYKQDENAPNAIVSYYTKGALVAFGLDMTLREASADRISLDDLMRRLWQRYGTSGRGVPERGIEQEAAALLDAPLDDFFQQYIYGTDELPLQAWFETVGIGQCLRPAKHDEDLGGYRADAKPGQHSLPPSLGARFEAQPTSLQLSHVIAGGAAQLAGLAPGDLLVALDGERLTAANLDGLLQRLDGEPADVHYFRRDRLAVTRLATQAAPADTCDLWLLAADELDSTVLARRAAWLRSNHLDIA